TYVTPSETHNPLELHSTTAIWDGSMLTLYESSQGVVNLRGVLAQMFGLPKENVRVITNFVGSGFGSKLWPWTQCPLAAAAARHELADQLKMDPVKLRILNEPKSDESKGIPFSSRHLLECFALGTEKLGWSRRTTEVGSMKRDGLTLGWGMAGCSRIAGRFSAAASLQLRDDGSARVASATQDIGTGMYTILAQLASQKTGVPLAKVEVALGDTALPEGPL